MLHGILHHHGLATNLELGLTHILDIHPHRVSDDVTVLEVVEANQTEGWNHSVRNLEGAGCNKSRSDRSLQN